MTCYQSYPSFPDAELSLRYEVDDSLPPIRGIGPAGRFLGEYRNGTEVYSVVISDLWGVSDHCSTWDD
ncbi:MAG: hypothetical protein RBU30_22810 [Polyangia bacterium]|nr:hypothetical protein [Polyangia bacterium]